MGRPRSRDAKMPVEARLGREHIAFIDQQVSAGSADSRADAIRHALELARQVRIGSAVVLGGDAARLTRDFSAGMGWPLDHAVTGAIMFARLRNLPGSKQ